MKCPVIPENATVQGDSANLLKCLEDESVDLVITSPPYGNLRKKDYGGVHPDKWKAWFDPIQREIHRVLKPTGSFVLNLKENSVNKVRHPYVYQTVLGMMDDGWKLRDELIWCLSSDTKMFVKINGIFEFVTVKELHDRKDDEIHVLTQDKDGNNLWIRVKNILNNGKARTIKLITKDGKSVVCTPNHEFVSKTSNFNPTNGKITYRIINTTRADQMKGKRIYINIKFNFDLPEGDNRDYDDGYLIGFYLAEGCKRKRKNNGGVKDAGIQLTCGISDRERGYLDKLKKWNFNEYHYPSRSNTIHLRLNGNEIVDFINTYVDGDYCDTKHLKKAAFNRSKKFLIAIIDGFLDGDGHYDKKNDRWRVGIKPNDDLKDQLQLICRMFGYDFRREKNHQITLKSNGKNYDVMRFVIRKKSNRLSFWNCIVEEIDSVKPYKITDVYDIEIEPIYTKMEHGSNQHVKGMTVPIETANISRYNYLYFLGNGMWTHNSKPNPFPIKPLYRFKDGWERLFHFTKENEFTWHPERVKVDSKPDTCARVQRGIDQKTVNHNSPNMPRYKRNYDRFKPDKFDCSKAYPRNIIEAPVGVGRTKHAARFPNQIPEFFIKLLSNEGDVVLDPFMGSGTVGVEAKKNCRKAIGFDLKLEYVEMANNEMNAVSCEVDDE